MGYGVAFSGQHDVDRLAVHAEIFSDVHSELALIHWQSLGVTPIRWRN